VHLESDARGDALSPARSQQYTFRLGVINASSLHSLRQASSIFKPSASDPKGRICRLPLEW
jgi:hypothetical protein